MKLFLLSIAFAAVLPPPLPITPQKFVAASEPATNRTMKLEWKMPDAQQVAIYKSTNLLDWQMTYYGWSAEDREIVVEIESEPGPTTFYKWEVLK